MLIKMDVLHIVIIILLLFLLTKPCNCTTNTKKEGFHGRRDYYGRSNNALYRDTVTNY